MYRLMIAGTHSGCGKTTVVCAVLQALKNRGEDVASFKCGPDYIDPMFHSEIIGTPGGNIDLFFTDSRRARMLFAREARALNVIEGAMGYYDGMAMGSDRASAYRVAAALDAPVVLVVNVRGMALSAAAVVKGFQSLRADHRIRGVILNGASAASCCAYRAAIEAACGVRVYGYLPNCPECALESRHLGLVTAREVENLREKMQILARKAEESIDIDGLIALMRAQKALEAPREAIQALGRVRIAVARDRAFCFYYRENLERLEALGAVLIPFSPLADAHLPACDGLYIGGGYPELYAEALSENRALLAELRQAVNGGLPTIAECGGFMLLCRKIGAFPMAGVFDTDCFDTGRLCRFGYVTLRAEGESLLFAAGDCVRGHEFHHWDAADPGSGLCAEKGDGRAWRCAYVTDALYAGYPHLSFESNPAAAQRFIQKCMEGKHETDGD